MAARARRGAAWARAAGRSAELGPHYRDEAKRAADELARVHVQQAVVRSELAALR